MGHQQAGLWDSRSLKTWATRLTLDPKFASAYWEMSRDSYWMGKYREYLEDWEKGATIENDQEEMAIAKACSQAFANGGVEAANRKELEMRTALLKRKRLNATEFARIHARLGEKDETFRWLNKALEDREYALVGSIKRSRDFQKLDSDPRYKEILRTMKLPE